ncbi:hypothetical protein LSP04_19590 [Levilactobacillus spicheri]|uniref:Uncharacterized protein n=1 Tax=Levilactobacillus spicheri TaxID=216463 RepID=A0ABQ0WUZ4_9LACO|nr:hypothetical protein LSP04_19590 [Levilactobacillus spicheri]
MARSRAHGRHGPAERRQSAATTIGGLEAVPTPFQPDFAQPGSAITVLFSGIRAVK